MVTCVISRRRHRTSNDNHRRPERTRTSNEQESTTDRVVENTGETNQGYSPEISQDPAVNEILQQPYTQVPEIKGIRI